MEEIKKHIFEPSGCLSKDAFLALLDGQLQGDDKGMADKHVASCPFCSDAIEGFSKVPSERKAILADIGKTFNAEFKMTTENIWGKRILWYSVAASVLLLVGFMTFFQIQPKKQEIAQNISPAKDTTKSITSFDIKQESPVLKQKELKVRNTPRVSSELAGTDKIIGNDAALIKVKPEISAAESKESSSKKGEVPSLPMKTEESKSIQSNAMVAKRSVSVSMETEELEPIEIIVADEKDGKKGIEPVFMYVEEKATFQGGDLQKFQRYILENFKISESVKSYGVSGKVIAQFVVGTEGKVENIKIIKGLNFGADNEMVRVLQNSPPWKPAKQGGKAVRQRFILPLTIDLKLEP